MRQRGGRGARCRRMVRPGHWGVRARVERFSEPALLLLLRERPTHGYELLEALPDLTGEARVDMGNLYRVLRAPGEDALATCRGEPGAPGLARTHRHLHRSLRREVNHVPLTQTTSPRPRPPMVRPGERPRAARELSARPRAGARRRLRPDHATARRRAAGPAAAAERLTRRRWSTPPPK